MLYFRTSNITQKVWTMHQVKYFTTNNKDEDIYRIMTLIHLINSKVLSVSPSIIVRICCININMCTITHAKDLTTLSS